MPVWTLQYGSEGNPDISDLTIDTLGNVYSCGLTWGPWPGTYLGGGGDAYLLKLAPFEVPEPRTLVLAVAAALLAVPRRAVQ